MPELCQQGLQTGFLAKLHQRACDLCKGDLVGIDYATKALPILQQKCTAFGTPIPPEIINAATVAMQCVNAPVPGPAPPSPGPAWTSTVVLPGTTRTMVGPTVTAVVPAPPAPAPSSTPPSAAPAPPAPSCTADVNGNMPSGCPAPVGCTMNQFGNLPPGCPVSSWSSSGGGSGFSQFSTTTPHNNPTKPTSTKPIPFTGSSPQARSPYIIELIFGGLAFIAAWW